MVQALVALLSSTTLLRHTATNLAMLLATNGQGRSRTRTSYEPISFEGARRRLLDG